MFPSKYFDFSLGSRIGHLDQKTAYLEDIFAWLSPEGLMLNNLAYCPGLALREVTSKLYEIHSGS